MGFFSDFFGANNPRSAILIDIGATSVGAAIARLGEDGRPTILYAKRVPIEPHAGEASLSAMARALSFVAHAIAREGSPSLVRAGGSGRADDLLVSLDAPWQTTVLHAKEIEKTKPFTFSRSLVEDTLARERMLPPGYALADESIVGTILNGYETKDPYGKRAMRARIIVLSSRVAQEAADTIAATLRAAFHAQDARLIAGASLRAQAVSTAFALEGNALIIDATSSELSLALLRGGLLVAVEEAGDGAPGTNSWTARVLERLRALAGRYPLPRIMFILAASEAAAARVASDVTAPEFRMLWLSENPPTALALTATHLASLVGGVTNPPADLLLGLMALLWSRTPRELYPRRFSLVG